MRATPYGADREAPPGAINSIPAPVHGAAAAGPPSSSGATAATPYGAPSAATVAGSATQRQTTRISWVDRTDEQGERTHAGGRFNLLHRLEALVRACNGSDRSDLAALLHGRCSLRVREGSYADTASEKRSVLGSEATAALLGQAAASAQIIRMEPAELLPSGETRVHWRDANGERHGLNAVWTADGRRNPDRRPHPPSSPSPSRPALTLTSQPHPATSPSPFTLALALALHPLTLTLHPLTLTLGTCSAHPTMRSPPCSV